MNKKTTLSLALLSVLSTDICQASVIDMDFSGLFTVLDPSGSNALQNSSYPYYGDTTWGYGMRTQISGSLQINTNTGYGTATVNPFEFYDGGPMVISDFELQGIGGGLLIGNMNANWKSTWAVQIVLDASGLFSEIPTYSPGDTYDATTCAISGACTIPASNDISNSQYSIGPALISTTSFNTTGQTGYGTTLSQLSLGADDGIGGSPQDNGPFEDFNFNIDMTSISFTDVAAVPVPAAIWLFGSGLIGLVGFARRKNT